MAFLSTKFQGRAWMLNKVNVLGHPKYRWIVQLQLIYLQWKKGIWTRSVSSNLPNSKNHSHIMPLSIFIAFLQVKLICRVRAHVHLTSFNVHYCYLKNFCPASGNHTVSLRVTAGYIFVISHSILCSCCSFPSSSIHSVFSGSLFFTLAAKGQENTSLKILQISCLMYSMCTGIVGQ